MTLKKSKLKPAVVLYIVATLGFFSYWFWFRTVDVSPLAVGDIQLFYWTGPDHRGHDIVPPYCLTKEEAAAMREYLRHASVESFFDRRSHDFGTCFFISSEPDGSKGGSILFVSHDDPDLFRIAYGETGRNYRADGLYGFACGIKPQE